MGTGLEQKEHNEYPYKKDDKLIANSLLFLLLDKSDPESVPDNGVYIQPNLGDYTSFDFAEARALIDSGYVQTLRQMDEIKAKIAGRVSCEEITARRNAFNLRSPPMVFDELLFEGFNARQRKYIRRIFHYNEKNPRPFYYSAAKSGYFRLVSEDYFSNVYPNILYDTGRRAHQIKLTRRAQKNFQVDFGGVIATRNISNIYLGLSFYNFNSQLLHLYTGFQTGNFYKAIDIETIKSRVMRGLSTPSALMIAPELVPFATDFQRPIDPVGIRVVEEIRLHSISRRSERRGDELRPERRAADPDNEHLAEAGRPLRPHPRRVDVRGEAQDARGRLLDDGAERGLGRELRRAQPVMADPAVLVGVRDAPALERRHLGERRLNARFHRGEKIFLEVNPAHVQPETEAGVVEEVGPEAIEGEDGG